MAFEGNFLDFETARIIANAVIAVAKEISEAIAVSVYSIAGCRITTSVMDGVDLPIAREIEIMGKSAMEVFVHNFEVSSQEDTKRRLRQEKFGDHPLFNSRGDLIGAVCVRGVSNDMNEKIVTVGADRVGF